MNWNPGGVWWRRGQNEEREREGNGNGGHDGPSWWQVGVGVMGGLTAAAAAWYMASRPASSSNGGSYNERDSNNSNRPNAPRIESVTDVVSASAVPRLPVVSNLNSLLEDIHSRFVAVKKEDLALHYSVFNNIFYKLHKHMKEVDPYYNRYSSRVQFAGSHYDRLRIVKPDEFDMDIVIGLPVNLHEDRFNPAESDIAIECYYPGFVQLRAGVQYKNILIRDGPDGVINKQAYLWLDERKYILRSKFISWFKSVVDRALNKFERNYGVPILMIGDKEYRIGTSSSGPAYTLRIRNPFGFQLDVDLVPTLKFPEKRWLGRSKAYRDIPAGCNAEFWTVVPKPNKFGATSQDEDRSWRVSLHDQERKFIHNSYHLRQVNRLLKKLRDTQEIRVASYHIKTLFLWKIAELNDPSFWRRDVATIFKVMLNEFHNALLEKRINYFWNRKHNMIERIPEHILRGYARKVGTLVNMLEDDLNYNWAARFLLTPQEYSIYNI